MGKIMTFTGPRPTRLYGYNNDAKYEGSAKKLQSKLLATLTKVLTLSSQEELKAPIS